MKRSFLPVLFPLILIMSLLFLTLSCTDSFQKEAQDLTSEIILEQEPASDDDINKDGILVLDDKYSPLGALYATTRWLAGQYGGGGSLDGIALEKYLGGSLWDFLKNNDVVSPLFINWGEHMYRQPLGTSASARLDQMPAMTYHGGVLYAVDRLLGSVRNYNAEDGLMGTLTTISHLNAVPGCTPDSKFNYPEGIAVMPGGEHLVVADTKNNTLRKVSIETGASEIMTNFCGVGLVPSAEDLNQITVIRDTKFNRPTGLAYDANGNLYIAESGSNVIRKLRKADNKVETFYTGLNNPNGLLVVGNYLYIADTNNHVIRRVNLTDKTDAEVIVGTEGSPGSTPPPASAYDDPLLCNTVRLNKPGSLALWHDHGKDKIVFTDRENHSIRSIEDFDQSATARCRYIVGVVAAGFVDGPCDVARLKRPTGLATDGTSIYFTRNDYGRIRKIVKNNGECVVSTEVGLDFHKLEYVEGSRSEARFRDPWGVASLPNGDLLVTDEHNNLLRRISFSENFLTDGAFQVTTIAGDTAAAPPHMLPFYETVDSEESGKEVKLYWPESIDVTEDGKWAVMVGAYGHILQLVDVETGATKTIAGKCYIPSRQWMCETGASDGLGSDARFNFIYQVTIGKDKDDNDVIYASDYENNTIRMIRPVRESSPGSGIYEPVPFDFRAEYKVTTPYGRRARPFNEVEKVIIDGVGNNTQFYRPTGIKYVKTSQGKRYLFVGDNDARQIRQIDLDTDQVTTICGRGGYGFSDGDCSVTHFGGPTSYGQYLFIDARVIPAKDEEPEDRIVLFVSDTFNRAIYQVDVTRGESIIISGSGQQGAVDGISRRASWGWPYGITYNKKLNRLFIVDRGEDSIRQILPPQ